MTEHTSANRLHRSIRLIRQPRRLARLLGSAGGRQTLMYAAFPGKFGALAQVDDDLRVREYSSYDAYIKHQKSKLTVFDLTEYDRTFRAALAERLKSEGDWAGKSVLCLAARIGTEVRAFHDAGAFAVGIDLEPGRDNSWVLPGDFHSLVFPDASVDALYCNSLDHALDLEKTLSEMRRAVKPVGRVMIDAQAGEDDNKFDEWAATGWASIDALVTRIENCGFKLESRREISVPQSGESLVFSVDKAASS